MKLFYGCWAVGAAVIAASLARSQTVATVEAVESVPTAEKPAAESDPVVVELRSLLAESRPSAVEVAPGASASSVVMAKQQLATEYLQKADRLRDFRVRNPSHASAKDAKREEALMLLNAAYAGDQTQDSRRSALVASLRRDAKIDVMRRAEIAALADNLEVTRRTDLSVEAKRAAYAEVMRRLNLEFPEVFVHGNPRPASARP